MPAPWAPPCWHSVSGCFVSVTCSDADSFLVMRDLLGRPTWQEPVGNPQSTLSEDSGLQDTVQEKLRPTNHYLGDHAVKSFSVESGGDWNKLGIWSSSVETLNYSTQLNVTGIPGPHTISYSMFWVTKIWSDLLCTSASWSFHWVFTAHFYR